MEQPIKNWPELQSNTLKHILAFPEFHFEFLADVWMNIFFPHLNVFSHHLNEP